MLWLDTYSLSQGQDEFYFALPYQDMDIALYCYNNHISIEKLANELSITYKQASNVYLDIENKRKMTQYLRMKPEILN